MGWTMPWSTPTDGFDAAFGVDRWHGTNAFIRDGDRAFRTCFVDGRGEEVVGGTWAHLDPTALGRQEEREDSPEAARRPRPTRGGTSTTSTTRARRRRAGPTRWSAA
jgi:predicted dithiol-disulfide oxidoreductase (DUF899 family)